VGAEVGFEDVSVGALAMEFDASSEGFCLRSGEGQASVHGCFVRGGGFRFDQAAKELKEGWLLATSTGEEGAHGNCRS
jgi:hypothetical protein